MAGNPYGNKNRCRTCNTLAGKDGYCKRHRVTVGLDTKINAFRDNFIPNNGYAKEQSYFNKEFGCVKNNYDCEEYS